MKKIAFITLTVTLVLALLFVFGVLKCEICVLNSPGRDYQIVSWLLDEGGFGYRGAYYIKEKGLFSKCHKIGTGPFSAEWLSNTEFFIYHSYPVDSIGSYYKEYSVNDFFD